MSILQNRLSDEPIVSPYIPPDDVDHGLNEDWERGPIGVNDSSAGMAYQDWHLTFAGGTFTVTPQTTGSPTNVLTGQDSVQCTFCFDQTGQPTISWIDSLNRGFIYWLDIQTGQPEIFAFQAPVTSVGLCLDDKRPRQVRVNDMLLWYTINSTRSANHALYYRQQRDRFLTPYLLADPVWPYIHKLGMNSELRVQVTLKNIGPV